MFFDVGRLAAKPLFLVPYSSPSFFFLSCTGAETDFSFLSAASWSDSTSKEERIDHPYQTTRYGMKRES